MAKSKTGKQTLVREKIPQLQKTKTRDEQIAAMPKDHRETRVMLFDYFGGRPLKFDVSAGKNPEKTKKGELTRESTLVEVSPWLWPALAWCFPFEYGVKKGTRDKVAPATSANSKADPRPTTQEQLKARVKAWTKDRVEKMVTGQLKKLADDGRRFRPDPALTESVLWLQNIGEDIKTSKIGNDQDLANWYGANYKAVNGTKYTLAQVKKAGQIKHKKIMELRAQADAEMAAALEDMIGDESAQEVA